MVGVYKMYSNARTQRVSVSSRAANAALVTPKAVFELLGSQLSSHPEVVAKVQGVYQWVITGDGGGKWVVDLKNGGGSVKEGEAEKADCTITVAGDSFVKMMTGKANSQQLFMQGKLKVKGSMAYAMKLGELQKLQKA